MTTPAQSRRSRIIFVTGTDTGVGKTLVAGLLLYHLRSQGVHALAMKPFCCGGLGDVRLLRELQNRELTPEQISPFRYDEPLAPLVAARMHRHKTSLAEVVTAVRLMQSKCECLVVEGIGGLLVPLGEGFCVRDLIAAIGCEVLVVAKNQVGTINHTLLTINSLREGGIRRMRIVLSGIREREESSSSNARILAELAAPHPVILIPFLGDGAAKIARIKKNAKKFKKSLAQILGFDTFSPPFGKSV